MFKILAVLVLLSAYYVGSGELHRTVGYSGCPPWTYRPNSTSPCQCESSVHGAIWCNITTGVLNISACWCLTYNERNNESVAGYCPYTCTYSEEQGYQLNMTRNYFTNQTCGPWNRAGPLCSQCIPEYGIPLHSYELKLSSVQANTKSMRCSSFLQCH